MKALRIPLGLCISLSMAGIASASSLDTIENLSQSEFIEFSEILSAATHYRSVSPPEPLGTIGFDVGLEVSSTDIDSDLFDLASGGSFDGSELVVPRVHVHKGLPFGLDVGASLSAVPDTDASIIGGELRFAIVDGGTITPSIGIRATHSRLRGIDDFTLESSAVELGISKGLLFLTPYAGVGVVRTKIDPHNIDGLSAETYEQDKVFIGATLNVGFALTLEGGRTGGIRTYSAKFGFRF